MPARLRRRPEWLARRRGLPALVPALVMAGATALAACGSSGVARMPDPYLAPVASPGFLEQSGNLDTPLFTPSLSDDAAAVQAYRAIVDRDSKVVIDDAYKLFDPCALSAAGDQACEKSVSDLKHAAQTMLADLTAARVPASIATADAEFHNGLRTFIAMADDMLSYVANGSIEAHDRTIAEANTAERQLNLANYDLATAP